MNFKIGDRVEVFDLRTQNLNPGDKGTIISGIDKYDCYCVDWDKSSLATRQIHSTWLRLINDKTKLMNDTDKIELTVADVKAAHAKGCSVGKAMVEAMFPKVFEEKNKYSYGDKFNEKEYGKHVLAKITASTACLIRLEDGNRWREPITVKCIGKLTDAEHAGIFGNGEWTKL